MSPRDDCSPTFGVDADDVVSTCRSVDSRSVASASRRYRQSKVVSPASNSAPTARKIRRRSIPLANINRTPASGPHPLYLLHNHRACKRDPIKFSGDMSLEQCEKFYRMRQLDYIIDDVPVVEMRPVCRINLDRLRKLAAEGKKDSNDDATASTVSMDDSRRSSMDSLASNVSRLSRRPRSRETMPTSLNRRPRFTVSFSPTVQVHHVPHVHSYPDDVFNSIWHYRSDWNRQKSAALAEAAYDDCNWRQATEEEEYVECPRTGRHVHPAHVKGTARKGVGAQAPSSDKGKPQKKATFRKDLPLQTDRSGAQA